MRPHRTDTRHVWLIGGIAVLLLDAGGALASRAWGFEYRALAPVSLIHYICAGVGAGRIAGVVAGGIAGAATALVDATLGRALAIALGAGSRTQLGPIGTAVVALGVVVTGCGLGLVGGLLGKMVHSHMVGPSEP